MISFEKIMLNDNTLADAGTQIKIGDKFYKSNGHQLGTCVSMTTSDGLLKIVGTNGSIYVNMSSFIRGWPIEEVVQAPVQTPVQNTAAVMSPQAKQKQKRKKDNFTNVLIENS